MRAQHLRRFRRTRQQRGVNPAATLQPDSCCGQLSLRNLQRGHNHALLGLNRRTIQAICTRRPHEVHHLCEGINVRICDIPIRSGVRMPGIEALQGRRRIGDHLRGVHPARRLARTGCAQQRKWLSGHRSRHSRSTGQRFEESRITGPGAIPARSSRIGREDHVLAVIGTAARCARGLPRWPYWLPPPRRACVLPASRSPTFPSIQTDSSRSPFCRRSLPPYLSAATCLHGWRPSPIKTGVERRATRRMRRLTSSITGALPTSSGRRSLQSRRAHSSRARVCLPAAGSFLELRQLGRRRYCQRLVGPGLIGPGRRQRLHPTCRGARIAVLADARRIEQLLPVGAARALLGIRTVGGQQVHFGKGGAEFLEKFTQFQIREPGIDDNRIGGETFSRGPCLGAGSRLMHLPAKAGQGLVQLL
jgi:hypothetical protein